MSKYTEAIELLRGTIFKCRVCDALEVADCKKCDFLYETCLEALEVADRLEQAEKKIARRMICDTCSEAETCGQGELGDWCGEYDVLLKTVKMALADIRGDAE